MIIAKQKKEENIAEYLLYLWQLEDILRSLNFDEEKARILLAERFETDDATKREIAQWYADLIQMMRQEGIQEKGHLQISRNVLIELNNLHLSLLASGKESFYKAAYFQTLPYIVELRSKQPEKLDEIETCFVALYGKLILHMKGEIMSEQTTKALEQITRMIALLAEKERMEKQGELEL